MTALAPGTRLGPYEVIVPLGAGGMGEVYRARDTRLGRDVAIKVLPQHLSANPEVRARFEREARTISGLNHPHICTLFDVGREGDIDFLVMELVEGETLAQRLQKGPLATPELLRLGAQIADALDRAHRAGVIHRDLKPGNVMLTRSGAKLMDFGLARATGMSGPAGPSGVTMAALTKSPTVASPLTAEGTIVGTFQYMSPEQLEGKEADARSDLWSFGCVLYEMATGRRAFEGRSQASLITSIMGGQPAPVTQLTPAAPPALERLVSALLAKDPDERVQTAHDAKLQLQWAGEAAGLSTSGASASAAAVAGSRRSGGRGAWLPWSIAVLALLAAVAMFAFTWPRAHAPRARYRFRIDTPPAALDVFWPRVSPDGRTLAFLTVDSAQVQKTWIRPLDELEARPVVGADGAKRPYWSPDGRELVFVLNGNVQRVPVTGGTPTVICAAQGGADLSWGSRGVILMDGSATDSLRSVPARGGELKPATRIDRAAGETGCAWPRFLPDGEHFLFLGLAGSSGFGGDIRLGRIGSLDSKRLGTSDGRVEYAPGGWVLYVRGSTLLARKLDLGAGKLTGEPITLSEDLRIGTSAGHFSVGDDGTIAIQRGDASRAGMLAFLDRAGKPSGEPMSSGTPLNPDLSPDGRYLLFERSEDAAGTMSAISVRDLQRGTETRLTFVAHASEPLWSPDGKRFAYLTQDHAGHDLVMVAPASGAGAIDSIPLPADKHWALTQWAVSGSRLTLFSMDLRSMVAIPSDGPDRKPQPLGAGEVTCAQPQISPDGRFVAFTTVGDGGLPQVAVRSLTGPPGRWQVSIKGGYHARWARDGHEIVFEQAGLQLMSADFESAPSIAVGTPQPLFALPVASPAPAIRSWVVSADGLRFVALVRPKSGAEAPIEVDTDFRALVERR